MTPTELSVQNWLTDVIPKHTQLSAAVCGIIERLLNQENIEVLAVSKRTKSLPECLAKISRKKYGNPQKELTDISGIRVIVFLESDVDRVCDLIEKSFDIDLQNSANKDALLSFNQTGYRSVHFVASLGSNRSNLPEFFTLDGLKFEIQVRTVLQHAWAELAHDRRYKFSEKLPEHLDRKLFLYAGMLELADKGFSEIAAEIDQYAEFVKGRTSAPHPYTFLDGIVLGEYFKSWSILNDVLMFDGDSNVTIMDELNAFGIFFLSDLTDIIPDSYARVARRQKDIYSVTGICRDLMIINSPMDYITKCKPKFSLGKVDEIFYSKFLSREDCLMLIKNWPNETGVV